MLGVNKEATPEQIKASYRDLAKKYHPDINPGNKEFEDKFKNITQAYNVLSDSSSKSKYDRENFRRPASDFNEYADIFGNMAQGEFYNAFFRDSQQARQRANRKTDGSTIEWKISIPLNFAMTGKTLAMDIPIKEKCDECSGSGKTKDSKEQICSTCGGAGAVRSNNGMFSISHECPRCRGKKTIIVDPCHKCMGSGYSRIKKKVQFDIPAGIESNMGLTIKGTGDVSETGGSRGNINIRIDVKEHEAFKREKYDLRCGIKIGFYQAIIGDTIEIENLDGEKIKVAINPETQSGSEVRIMGKGMKMLNANGRGNLIISFLVETPKNLSKEVYDVFNKLKIESGQENKFELIKTT